jgi:pilus assembly protein CpaB
MMRVADWPSASVPAGALADDAKLVDRVTRTSVQKGEPILESKLAPEGAKAGLSAVVMQGKRAMTVRVNDVIGVAGFALPGNFVDIMVNTQEEGKGANRDANDTSVSKIVLEHILVLAVAQEAGRDESKPKVVNAVTLEVTPAEAEKLDLARSVGTLSLVLRNQIDPKLAQSTGATKATLLGTVRQAPPVPKTTLVPTVATVQPAARKATPPAKVAAAPRECVLVISGKEISRECF